LPVEEARPVVYRAGKLPKEIPSWFQQFDTDRDGQIGLYEWRQAGQSLDDFRRMDRNDDGFLTIAEVLRSAAPQVGNGGTAATPALTGTGAPNRLAGRAASDGIGGFGPRPFPSGGVRGGFARGGNGGRDVTAQDGSSRRANASSGDRRSRGGGGRNGGSFGRGSRRGGPGIPDAQGDE
jgi:hypothetical protein